MAELTSIIFSYYKVEFKTEVREVLLFPKIQI